jgi:aldose 1-epimerase
MPVADTPLDFVRERLLSDALTAYPDGLDHSYVLASGKRDALAPDHVASLVNRANGVSLDLATTQPCLQVYTASQLTSPVAAFYGDMSRSTGFSEWSKPCLGSP